MAGTNSQNTRLVYGDFIPIKGGSSGKARNYVSPSTGEVIPLRQFQKNASRIAYTPPPAKKRPTTVPRSPPATKGPPAPPAPSGTQIVRGGTTLFSQAAQRANALDRYYRALDGFIKTANEKSVNLPGHVPLTRNEARQSGEFKMYYKAYKNTNDRKKGGRRHQALIYFGFMEEDDDYY